MNVIKICSLSGINTGDAIISKSIEYLMANNGINVKSIDIENRPMSLTSIPVIKNKRPFLKLINKSKMVRYIYKRLRYRYLISKNVLRECKDYDVIIFGGGNMYFNYIGCPYLYSFSLLSSKLKSKVQVSYGVGVGPFSFPWKNQLKTIVQNSSMLSVRDAESQKIIQDATGVRVSVFSDPAFILSDMEFQRVGTIPDDNYFTVNIMEYQKEFYPNVNQNIGELSKNLCSLARHYALSIKIILTSKEDFSINEKVLELISESGINCELVMTDINTDFEKLYRNSTFSLCNRMHSAIFSYSFNIPTLVYPWQPKITGMLETIASNYADNLTIDVNFPYELVIDKLNAYPAECVFEGVINTKARIYNEAKMISKAIRNE